MTAVSTARERVLVRSNKHRERPEMRALYGSQAGSRPSPLHKLLMIFENIDRDFIIALQGLPGVGTKRQHPALHIGHPGNGVGLEVEPSLRQDTEKYLVVIQPIRAEHATTINLPQPLQL